MDGDSFRDRVDKIFGSLSSSSSSTPWSLSDAEVEKRVWKARKTHVTDHHQTPSSSSSSFPNFCSNRNRNRGLEDPTDEHIDDDTQTGGPEGDDDTDEWEIRSSIGLDSTLDNEEEEDAYDKMAEGRENGGDRLYMKDVTDHGPYLNSHNVLPSSVHDAPKHPRADHEAAKTRLKEDDGAGVSGTPVSPQAPDEAMLNVEGSSVKVREDSKRLKSILKRKSEATVKSAKRVRFDPTCKNHSIEEYEQALEENEDALTGQSSVPLEVEGDDTLLSESRPSVPDYIVNPSKYTRYSFDRSHDVNEESNTQACMNFLEHVRKSQRVELEQALEDNPSADGRKPVFFVPRKKGNDGKQACNREEKPKQSSTQAGSGVGIAAEEVLQGEVSMTLEEEWWIDAISNPTTKARLQKPARQYRTKSAAEENVC